MAQEDITTSNTPEDAALLEQLQLALEEEQALVAKQEQEMKEALEDLGRLIPSKLAERRSRRANKESQWLLAERLNLGNLASTRGFNYDAESPFENKKYSDRPERNIVMTKKDIAKAQLYSMQFSGGEKNWDILPPENREELLSMGIENISERCDLMERTIAAQLEEAKFEREAIACFESWTVQGTGIIKGPENTGKTYRTYVPIPTPDGRTMWKAEVRSNPRPCLRHVQNWFCYPDDSTNDFNSAEDVIEIHPKSGFELRDWLKNPAFIKEALEKAIAKGPNPHQTDPYASIGSMTEANPSVFSNKYTVIEYHGPLTKDILNKINLDPSVDTPDSKYFAEVWVINDIVVRIELSNIEGCVKPPYSAVVWVADPTSPFGFGIPLLLKDSQRVVNTTWHMILDNASASSAPQVVIQEDMISPVDGEFTLDPGKVWLFNDITGDVKKAVQFFNTPNVTGDIFPVLEAARQGSEEESGIAMIAAGLQSSEVGSDTATGQAIMQKASTVLLEIKSNQFDELVMEPRLQAMYDWNMQYNPDDTIKAPMTLRIRSSTDYRTKQMYIRDMEKLSVEASQNPALGDWINQDELAKTRLGMMQIPVGGIVKSVDQYNQEQEAKAANPPPPTKEEVDLQIQMRKLDLEEKRLMIEKGKLAFEQSQGQRREEMEYEERMVNTYARIAEAESELQRAQTDKEIEYIKLAAKTEDSAERNAIMGQMSVMSEETKRILGGLEHMRKSRDQLITERELDLAEATGEGI